MAFDMVCLSFPVICAVASAIYSDAVLAGFTRLNLSALSVPSRLLCVWLTRIL